jgi:hypothetical protein
MLLPAFNAVVGFVAIGFRVPVFLTTSALDGCLLGARRFYSDRGVEQVMEIIYFRVVRLGFQIHEEKGEGFFCDPMPYVYDVSHLMSFGC